ncbi:MAG TPA: hypothetical protein VHX39_10550, partial [Acetobacteraceae bacterium]|nr:hypothetical protein [Acetobacteraceae bacterium]
MGPSTPTVLADVVAVRASQARAIARPVKGQPRSGEFEVNAEDCMKLWRKRVSEQCRNQQPEVA